jgi:hypothetical protein
MAAYGSGYYGGGNYSYGVSLGAADITATSSASVSGTRFVFGAFDVVASSTVVVDGKRVQFSGFDLSASSSAAVAPQR